ncbi:sensor domain-containing diguanylate cyclase [Paenibacillus piri]|nr:sensor domain-containing diguanylate cyclase [Paenibacillus piri]
MGNDAVQDSFFRQLIERSGDFILRLDLEGAITYCSPAFLRLMGDCSGTLLGKPCFDLIFDQDTDRFRHQFRLLTGGRKPFFLEYRYDTKDGVPLWVEGTAYLFNNESVPEVALISRDISRYKNVEERLTQMAYYDALTGLPNRRLFQDRYKQAILLAKRYERRLALFYLDLDDFKQINDRYGHAVGDELLKKVASRLLHCVRDPDTVCRLGGDEFVILLQQVDHSEDIHKVAQRVMSALNKRFVIGRHDITVACSMGAALYPQDGSEEQLIQSADKAMYQSKKHGKHYSEFH